MEECRMPFDKRPKKLLFIVRDFKNENISSLGTCLSSLSTPEVVVVSVQDGSLYQLSPVFPRPRHLLTSTVSEVKGRRTSTRPINLKGEVVPVGTIHHHPPYIMFKSSYKLDDLDGTHGVLFKELSHRLNFTMELKFYNDWREHKVNGTEKTGLFKAALVGEVELTINNAWQIASFYAFHDFGPSLKKVRIVFLVRRPELMNIEWRVFFTIFRPEVWLAIVTSYVLVVAVFWASTRWNQPSRKESVGNCCLIAFGILTSASFYSRFSESHSRFILTFWTVCTLMITTGLSTGWASKSTVPRFTQRVDTIKQMVEDKYIWALSKYRTIKKYTNETKAFVFDFTNPWIVALEKRYSYIDPEVLRDRLRSQKDILLLTECDEGGLITVFNLDKIGQETLHMFRKAREVISSTHSTFGVRKHSTLLEPLTLLTLKFLEAGLPTKWLDDLLWRWPEYNTKHLNLELDKPQFTEPQPLRLRNMQAIFYMLLLGLGFGLIVFVCELLYYGQGLSTTPNT